MPATCSVQRRWLTGDGVRLRAVTAGDPHGPPVVLLHGFPDFWYGWRHQIGPLAASGFHVIALDQRGYNRSDKPPRVADYATDRLASDVVKCLDGLSVDRAVVVGHDWGGGVGWHVAAAHPDRVAKLVVLNCPHPVAMQAALEGSFAQLVRSWYVFAFQIPGLPECVAAGGDFRLLARAVRRSSRPGTFSDRDLRRYRRAWGRPGALTAMVNWYRAAARYGPRLPRPRVTVPTLLLWGERDRFLDPDLADASAALCDDVRLVRFPAATHWVHQEEPREVNRLIAEFVGTTPVVVTRP
ncbi:alpha/beta fold hydrolase [Gemmata sp.]|uniref:alpha/beta fold hydrolase n=1 Tax=Gemmata sp. TaxID=1914242 RepID=UPI003F709B51